MNSRRGRDRKGLLAQRQVYVIPDAIPWNSKIITAVSSAANTIRTASTSTSSRKGSLGCEPPASFPNAFKGLPASPMVGFWLRGITAVTARLEIRLRRPVGVGERLTFRAEVLHESAQGFNLTSRAELDDGTVVADGQARLVKVDGKATRLLP